MNEADRTALVEFTFRLEKDIARALRYTTFEGELGEIGGRDPRLARRRTHRSG